MAGEHAYDDRVFCDPSRDSAGGDGGEKGAALPGRLDVVPLSTHLDGYTLGWGGATFVSIEPPAYLLLQYVHGY